MDGNEIINSEIEERIQGIMESWLGEDYEGDSGVMIEVYAVGGSDFMYILYSGEEAVGSIFMQEGKYHVTTYFDTADGAAGPRPEYDFEIGDEFIEEKMLELLERYCGENGIEAPDAGFTVDRYPVEGTGDFYLAFYMGEAAGSILDNGRQLVISYSYMKK